MLFQTRVLYLNENPSPRVRATYGGSEFLLLREPGPIVMIAAIKDTANPRFVALDLLRFLAAAAVMVYHFTYIAVREPQPWLVAWQPVVKHGYLGVHLFFIISGFVILWSARGRQPRSFVRARLLRLYPEFWISVVISALIFTRAPGGFGDSLTLKAILLNLTMVPQYLGAEYVDDVYWTLGVEIKFYVITWTLLALGQMRRIEAWIYAWIFTLAVSSVTDTGAVVRSLIIFPYGALFAAGGIFFLVYESGWSARRIAAIALALVLSSYHAVRAMQGFMDSSDITDIARFSTVGIVCVAFALISVAVVGRVKLRLSVAVAATIGSLTYPLYLLHNTGKELFLRCSASGGTPALVLSATIFSICAAYVAMRLGTGPVRRLLAGILDTLPLLSALPRGAKAKQGSFVTPTEGGGEISR